jgi:CBS domain-containing protein
VTVSKDTPLSELEKILADRRITGAPVVDEKGTMVGVVSMRDLIDRYSEEVEAKPSRNPSWFEVPFEHVLEDEACAPCDVPTGPDATMAEATVADIMTADVVSVPADAGIREIARTMTQRKVHRVLVEHESQNKAYVGIVGTFEILDMLAE